MENKTKTEILSTQVITPKEELLKMEEGCKHAIRYFEEGVKWAKATLQLYESHVKEAQNELEKIQSEIKNFEENQTETETININI